MKTKLRTIIASFLALSLMACSEQPTPEKKELREDQSTPQQTKSVNSYVSLFEIPATDIDRAISFYEAILDIDIEKMKIPEMEMGVLPYEDQVVIAVIMKGEGYVPSADGVTIYLNGGDNLQSILDKIEVNGGKILVPKTSHADESGYFALFLDSEGNKMGLNSPN